MIRPWMKPISVVLCWAMIVLSFPVHVAAQDEKQAVAILDLEGRGISALEAQTLTDRMRSELVNTGAVMVVERGQMQDVLEEQGFQQTGCVSSECAVEVGKLLGVSQMVTGSIGKIGQSYTIDVRQFSVETGAISKSVNRTYKGEVDGLIMEIERISWALVDLTPPPGRFPGMEPSVVATPQQAATPVEEPEEKPKKKGGFGKLLLGTVVLAALGGGGYYAYSSGMLDDLLGTGPKPLPEPPGLPE